MWRVGTIWTPTTNVSSAHRKSRRCPSFFFFFFFFFVSFFRLVFLGIVGRVACRRLQSISFAGKRVATKQTVLPCFVVSSQKDLPPPLPMPTQVQFMEFAVFFFCFSLFFYFLGIVLTDEDKECDLYKCEVSCDGVGKSCDFFFF